MRSQCTNCGASIKNVVIIDGKPYGTTCAEAELGIKLPPNFSGDYNEYKREADARSEERRAEFAEVKARTRKFFPEMVKLSRAMVYARRRDNDWEVNFISSLSRQTGLPILYDPKILETDKMDEVYLSDSDPSNSYLYNEPAGLDSLSEKQREILERIAEPI